MALIALMHAHLLENPSVGIWGPAAPWLRAATRRVPRESPYAIMSALAEKPFARSLELLKDMKDTDLVAFVYGADVRKQNMACLCHSGSVDSAWLQDTTIDAWVKLWCVKNSIHALGIPDKTKRSESREHIVTGSFFARRLKDFSKEIAETDKTLQKNVISEFTKKMARQFQHVDIFQYKNIIFPVNNDAHWIALRVCIGAESVHVEAYDSMVTPAQKMKAGIARQHTKLIMTLLTNIAEYYDGLPAPTIYQNSHNFRAKSYDQAKDVNMEVPQQENCDDCGVFTCMFIGHLTVGQASDFKFRQTDIDDIRDYLAWDIIEEGKRTGSFGTPAQVATNSDDSDMEVWQEEPLP